MKDCQRTPIIINLAECTNKKEQIANAVKKRFQSLKCLKKCKTDHGNSKINNIYTMSECDDVLKNDFKWLINFNLKEIPIYDIEQQLPDSKLVKSQRNNRRKKNVIKHKHKLSLSDIIEQCLFIKGEATIQEINKWIGDVYPCFRSSGCTWKNSVRNTLLKNQIFSKRKLKLSKSYLWCLDKNYLKDSTCIEQSLHQSAELSVNDNYLTKPRSSEDFKEFTTVIQAMKENISLDGSALNITNINDIPENITEMHPSASWIDSKEIDEKSYIDVDEDLVECYEMPAEFQDENGESVQVHFLDENNILVPIELF